ncbi:hypothetical protein [Shewanella surugensis]|uniref:Uncharacterized protein n=1 Tax=Shewanella surugensis TaxID=212020 RepID=A0ABT0LAE6_9GAMM|nr:hypothetical protein [Shewanella surugensis]MCL1124455.1 hypothetical protein [Shewanella surugensis]
MFLDNIIKKCQIVADILENDGLSRQAERINKTIRMLSQLTSLTDIEAQKKLSTKPYRTEITFLLSAVTDIKGLKDMCPTQLSYDDWRAALSVLKVALDDIK